jgi:predicted transposase YdaD
VQFNRFDVSTKELVWDDPTAWLEGFGIGPRGPVEVIDSDITTLSAAADKVIRVGGQEPYLVNIELQSSHETTLARTLSYRQVALDYRHDLPVLTVLVLLRKEANSPGLTGTYERRMPDGRFTNRYDYHVVRLWQEDVEPFLNAGIGLVPLAPLTDVPEADLPQIVGRMAERINAETRPRAAKLWTATYLLMGLRYSDELTDSLLEGVQTMQESTTYQKILREGRNEGRNEGRDEGRNEGRNEGRISEAHRMLLRLGRKKYRDPDVATIAAIEAIKDIDRLEALGERILDPDVRDWAQLLETP